MSTAFSFAAPPIVTLRLGDTVLAQAAAYSVKASQALFAAESFGSALPTAIVPGSLRFTLLLERLLWEDFAVDFYTLSNFSVDITRCGRKITFSGCQWSHILEESGHSLLWEKATLTARERTEVSL